MNKLSHTILGLVLALSSQAETVCTINTDYDCYKDTVIYTLNDKKFCKRNHSVEVQYVGDLKFYIIAKNCFQTDTFTVLRYGRMLKILGLKSLLGLSSERKLVNPEVYDTVNVYKIYNRYNKGLPVLEEELELCRKGMTYTRVLSKNASILINNGAIQEYHQCRETGEKFKEFMLSWKLNIPDIENYYYPRWYIESTFKEIFRTDGGCWIDLYPTRIFANDYKNESEKKANAGVYYTGRNGKTYSLSKGESIRVGFGDLPSRAVFDALDKIWHYKWYEVDYYLFDGNIPLLHSDEEDEFISPRYNPENHIICKMPF